MRFINFISFDRASSEQKLTTAKKETNHQNSGNLSFSVPKGKFRENILVNSTTQPNKKGIEKLLLFCRGKQVQQITKPDLNQRIHKNYVCIILKTLIISINKQSYLSSFLSQNLNGKNQLMSHK